MAYNDEARIKAALAVQGMSRAAAGRGVAMQRLF